MEYHHGAVTEFVTQFSDEDMTNLDPEIWHCVQRVYDEVSMTLNPSPELEEVKHWDFYSIYLLTSNYFLYRLRDF